MPLVEVAWSDGRIQRNERRAILAGAHANGLAKDSPGYDLLEHWLERPPNSALFEVWRDYVADVCPQLNGRERRALRDEILGRALAVAEAAGSLFGLGNNVSREEAAVLRGIEAAFGSGSEQ